MLRIDPGRLDLAREFRDNPGGPHSPALQRVLQILRWQPVAGKRVLVVLEPGRRWRIGINPGRRGAPIEFEGEVLTNSAEAQWALFRRRWEIATGEALQLPEEDPRGSA